ncbi:hypothetical protein [Hyphomicrobium sp.]|uniref:hypothetical protein n=1 Tax=Hyphomicrobium sp. TaxID=82 RepID=UPI002E33A234|nr:hypothetical protein [Hyphomicrobium sp.]HEX2842166.1 hypothetical protein [Hyphomicrobium sp.]
MNYVLLARSNYFRVRDPKRFERWCSYFGIEYWTGKEIPDSEDLAYAIAADNGEGWPSSHPETGHEFNFDEELAKHLDPRDIALLYQVGNEGLRYISGHASAIHADGRAVHVGLHTIQDLARKEFGEDVVITDACY